MRSDLPKVLHPIGGKPLLQHVVATAKQLSPSRLAVVIGHGGEAVARAIGDPTITYATQSEQKGTGHAVMQALPALEAGGTVLVLYGDVPLIAPETLRSLVDAAANGHLALLTQELADPKGYGRLVRDGGRVQKIVEEKDATEAERAIREINTGIMAMPRAKLDAWLAGLRNDNAQAEYYLTDVVAAAVADGTPIDVRHPSSPQECVGVNSKAELAALERHYQMNQARKLLDAGVTLADPARIDVRGDLTCGRDVAIDVNCIFEGRVVLGDDVKVGAHCILRDVEIGNGTTILPFSMIEQATVGANARIGPYARVRPDSKIGDEAHIGNFVEVKASTIGQGSKANHLAYVGDSTVGRDVNIGAGTITCNYDGANKHRSVIGDDAHIGSNCVLVAPITVGAGATIGGGSTIVKEAPAGQLTLARARQVSHARWQRPRKKG